MKPKNEFAFDSRVVFSFQSEKNSKHAFEAIVADKRSGWKRSESKWIQKKNRLEFGIKARDLTAWKAGIHGALKSVALIQKIQTI